MKTPALPQYMARRSFIGLEKRYLCFFVYFTEGYTKIETVFS